MVDHAWMGTIDTSLVSASCNSGNSAAVYIFDGSVTQPDDVDGIAPEPVISALDSMDES